MLKKLSFKYLAGLLVVIASLVWLAVISFPDNKLHLIFCDVGQGDATLITKGFSQVLIDGGPNDKVLKCLSNNMPFWDKTIEIVALTHPEADHMVGLLSVLDKYKIDTFLTGPEGNESVGFAALKSKIKNKNTKVFNPYTGENIRLGEINLQTLWPEKMWVTEKLGSNIVATENQNGLGNNILGVQTGNLKLNQFSLVFLLKYKNMTAILMGDADQAVDNDILLWNRLMPLDILKFPHHGSKTGMLESFLETIKPKETIISVGKNSYGHPTLEALDLLKKYGVNVRRTDLEGDIKYSF